MTDDLGPTFRMSAKTKREAEIVAVLFAAWLAVAVAQNKVNQSPYLILAVAFSTAAALRAERAAVQLTRTGIRRRGVLLTHEHAWGEITAIEVIGGKRRRRVQLVGLDCGRAIALWAPFGVDPDFDAKVDQIRAAWRAGRAES